MAILISNGWVQCKLGDLVDERVEKNNNSSNFELLSVSINEGVQRLKDTDRRDTSSENKENYKIVKINDIPYNSMRMWQGSSGVSEYDGIVSPAYTVLTPKTDCNSKYLAYLFKTEKALNVFTRFSQGLTTDTWNLKFNILKDIKFFAPNIFEQEKISQLILKLDKTITLEQEKFEKYSDIKNYLLKLTLANKTRIPCLRFKGFDNLWNVYKLKDLGEIKTGKTPPTNNKNNYTDSESPFAIPFITPTYISEEGEAIPENYVSMSGVSKAVIADKGCILVTCIASIGKILLTDFTVAFNQQINAIYPKENYVPYFLYQLSFKWTQFMKNISPKSTMQIVNKNTFSEIETNIPNKNEQYKIAKLHKNIDKIIFQQKDKISKLQSLKQFLFNNLFI